jgi:peptidoglycan hydrolase-like protein with peptidoglycan-binding domain
MLGIVVCLIAPTGAHAASARVAALQVALRSQGFYGGTIDGVSGPGTTTGLRRLQQRKGLAPDGVVGPLTRRALGAHGRHPIGSRPLRDGHVGWDVAALQFALETSGFPCGPVDGGLGPRVTAAIKRFQVYAGLPADGVAGPATLQALRRPKPAAPRLYAPIGASVGDRYGPRGTGFHAGLDFPADTGTTVRAAAAGRVVFVGYAGGWGLNVLLDHGNGLRTRYAHLSRATVGFNARVQATERVGLVGSTGFATGPHLHFEVTVRGANIDPARSLGY